jgi:radical SAM family uncharacterized protein/radical SAM-linked protein
MTTHDSLQQSVNRVLLDVTRPARYAGCELNIVRKDHRTQRTSVCLAFPDVYDIGQSYIGFHILYHILNRRSSTVCERTFAPWPDMEETMRREELPLWSLETFTAVSAFDVIGFTLQYELHYTAVLNMLDLAGIPLETADRTADHPLIIGGGTCAVNPEPVAPYFDALLLGDGEEAFPEILDAIEAAKDDGLSRADTLRRLAGIEGVYVPSLYRPVTSDDGSFKGIEPVDGDLPFPIRARITPELKLEYYPDKPLVPLTEVVHDRLAVEIMRGCPHGCRFCGAGMTYRPWRVRSLEDITSQIRTAMASTGFEEVSFVSLSTSDFPGIEKLVSKVSTELGSGVSISLSSLRADSFSLRLAEATAGGRKPTLTFALEAGTQRLRDVINKQLTEEQLFETVETALVSKFTRIKLYLMIGLPTETDEDIDASIDLLNRLGKLCSSHKGGRLTVTLAPFSPKPHTPFQWERQDSLAVLNARLAHIKSGLKSRAVSISRADARLSMLECRLGRGGREMAPLIRSAWERGSRLDGWSEHFNWDIWHAVFEDAGIDITSGGPARGDDVPLPWHHLNTGVDDAFLRAERDRAIAGTTTPDCRDKCSSCGPYAPFCAEANHSRREVGDSAVPQQKDKTSGQFGRRRKPVSGRGTPVTAPGTRLRIKYAKEGTAVYTSHRDLIRIFDRTLRRSGIPVAFSQGFHPHPKLSFGPPLPLGFSGRAEYLDLSLSAPCANIATLLSEGFPPGFTLLGAQPIPEKTDSLASVITVAEYFVKTEVNDELIAGIERIVAQSAITVERRTKKGIRTVNIRPGIYELRTAENDGGLTMLLSLAPDTAVKPLEVLAELFGDHTSDDITRIEQYVERDGERVTPMDLFGIYR